MKIILILFAALLIGCAQYPQTAKFGGKTYAIHQNTRGVVYGVPIK